MKEEIKEFLDGLLCYAQFLPGGKDIPFEVMILRGHLLIEEELRKIIKSKFIEPGAYDLQQTKYSALLRLAKALYGKALPVWKWEAAQEVNVIRNSIAHHLKDETIEPRLGRLFRSYQKHDDTFACAEKDSLKRLAYCLSDIHISLLKIRT